MAKKKKQRKVDFTKEEIMDMSQRGSVQDLDYRLKKMKSYYGLDTSGFKTDSEGSGTESFFPAECGELLSLLCRNFDFNPAGRTKSAAKNVTATQVGDYYGRLCKEIDNLPLPFKSMVYGLPCHFASNGIGIWAERIVPILTKFITSYVEETQEDMGLLLKRLAIDIDRADYTLFVNQYSLVISSVIPYMTLKASRSAALQISITSSNFPVWRSLKPATCSPLQILALITGFCVSLS